VQVTTPPVTVAASQPITVPETVHIERLWSARQSPRGTVDVTAPAGFTARRTSTPYTVGRDGGADVTVVLHGELPTGSSGADGEIRVLVDGQTETFPVTLTVGASSA
jgi:hypothetical protein